MLTEYDFIYELTPTDFEVECNKMIKRGWRPIGGISVSNRTQAFGADQTIFAQAFVWIEQEEDLCSYGVDYSTLLESTK